MNALQENQNPQKLMPSFNRKSRYHSLCLIDRKQEPVLAKKLFKMVKLSLEPWKTLVNEGEGWDELQCHGISS